MKTSEAKMQLERRESRMQAFTNYIMKGTVSDSEKRTLLEGSQSLGPGWTQQGGFLVPQEFYDEILLGMAQVDPLLDEDRVRLDRDLTLASTRPRRVTGWDLSKVEADQVGESLQETKLNDPQVSAGISTGWMFRVSLSASVEFEQDMFKPVLEEMKNAFSVAFARGIGKALVNGSGSGAPAGILTGAVNSGYTTLSNSQLSLNDFTAIFFSVNRIYRSSPKAAWVMSDSTYQLVRQSVDNQGRPLIPLTDDAEKILGKPVLIAPSMPGGPNSKAIIFGSLENFYVRVSPMAIQRTDQLAEYGQGVYIGRMRADSKVFDPTNSVTPPLVYATLHS